MPESDSKLGVKLGKKLDVNKWNGAVSREAQRLNLTAPLNNVIAGNGHGIPHQNTNLLQKWRNFRAAVYDSVTTADVREDLDQNQAVEGMDAGQLVAEIRRLCGNVSRNEQKIATAGIEKFRFDNRDEAPTVKGFLAERRKEMRAAPTIFVPDQVQAGNQADDMNSQLRDRLSTWFSKSFRSTIDRIVEATPAMTFDQMCDALQTRLTILIKDGEYKVPENGKAFPAVAENGGKKKNGKRPATGDESDDEEGTVHLTKQQLDKIKKKAKQQGRKQANKASAHAAYHEGEADDENGYAYFGGGKGGKGGGKKGKGKKGKGKGKGRDGPYQNNHQNNNKKWWETKPTNNGGNQQQQQQPMQFGMPFNMPMMQPNMMPNFGMQMPFPQPMQQNSMGFQGNMQYGGSSSSSSARNQNNGQWNMNNRKATQDFSYFGGASSAEEELDGYSSLNFQSHCLFGLTGEDTSASVFQARTRLRALGKHATLVDSCANKYLSRNRDDFVYVTDKKCNITGTAGSKPGFVGRLKDNVLGLSFGVHFPDLPPEITRILPMYGDDGLDDHDWEIHLGRGGGVLTNTATGAQVPVDKHRELILPVCGFDIFDLNGIPDEGPDMCCTAVDETQGYSAGSDFSFVSSKQKSDLLLHKRCGHYHIPGMNVSCPECDRAKGARSSHAKVRPTEPEPQPLKSIAIDFAPAISPTSVRGYRCVLVCICDCIKKTFARPLKLKADVVEEVEEIIKGIRQDYSLSLEDEVVWFIRRDNEPVLGSGDMTNMLQTLRVADSPTCPYNPQENGTVERFMRTLFGSVRAMLVGVDSRLWCYCVVYSSDRWNRLPHDYAKCPEYNGRSPAEILDSRVGRKKSNLTVDSLRRFGSLVYFREQIDGELKKLDCRWRRGVFLGLCPKSSGWIVGTYVPDGRTKAGFAWREYSTRDVKFRENILVSNLEDLQPNKTGIYVPYDHLDSLYDGASQLPFPSPGQAANLDRRSGQTGSEHTAERKTGNTELEVTFDEPDGPTPQAPRKTASDSGPQQEAQSRGRPKAQEPAAGRKRGRPCGVKDSFKRVRRSKAELEKLKKDASVFSSLTGCEELFDEGETFVESHIMLSAFQDSGHAHIGVEQALKQPKEIAEKWRKAIDKEEARLLIYETWKPASDQELATASQVIPIAIILSIKRDGTYKARAVALGNLDRSGGVETFSPVVSHAANRLLLTSAAADGDYIIAYDVDNAFLNAELDRDVFCRLPKVWAAKHGSDVVKLKKALYGLKDAPKKWQVKYAQQLKDRGWQECESAPGLWRKESVRCPGKWMKKSVYVDDNVATGPNEEELRAELQALWDVSPSREIETTKSIDSRGYEWVTFDLLGAIVRYCREGREFKLTMEAYIDKLQKKYDIQLGKLEMSPNFDEEAFHQEGSKVVDGFNLREFVGGLQWIATIARPDVTVPVSTLARYTSEKPTVPMVKACRKVLKYLVTTRTEGVGFSPEQEYEFDKLYESLLPAGRQVPLVNLFSDAGFANCLKTMRSTSGSIMYFRSCPIIWKSNRQTVRAYSTSESEYIAASDAIVLSEHHDFLDFFNSLPIRSAEPGFGIAPDLSEAVIWMDNESAIATAKSTDTRPKSRHYALRWLRVREKAGQIAFCPTSLMKADALTKLVCSVPQRRLLLHTTTNPVEFVDDSETGSDDSTLFATVFLSDFGFP